ncbi:MAG: hypothetical protein HC809_05395 [Gammaproteobacteria bacterium]|nr:hypothetical protein [Gammaproteobacteria bacterium]
MIGRLPLSFGYAIADALTPLHYHLFRRRRSAVLANLRVADPGRSALEQRATARRIMRSYNRTVFEFFRLPRIAADDLEHAIEMIGLEHVERARQGGRGVIVTSCHIGNWELGAVQLARHGYPVTAVAGNQFGRWLGADVRAAKERLAVSTVAPEDGFRKLWRALARNEVVALMVDGDIFSAGSYCDFLGQRTPWPAGPGVLSARTGAPIVSAYCERLAPGKFRIRFEAPLRTDATASELNATVATTSGDHVSTHLDQWCIFRRLWTEARADA